jgi:hypothetical protein
MDIESKGSHSPIAADVRRAVDAMFNKADRPAVLAALDGYRSDDDAARVHRAILSLSFSNLREVERLVEMACENRREVLHMAESGKLMAEVYDQLGLRRAGSEPS